MAFSAIDAWSSGESYTTANLLQDAIDGACDGYMWGGIGVGIGGVSSAVKSVNSAKTGYYQDSRGVWHRENGQFASNSEVGGLSSKANSSGIHGNSLKNTSTNYGYALVDKDTGEILKFGETLHPNTRYSKGYLQSNNAVMQILDSGTKADIHMWQYDMNSYYKFKYGDFPPLNKRGW